MDAQRSDPRQTASYRHGVYRVDVFCSRCELAVSKTLGSRKLYKIDLGAHELFFTPKDKCEDESSGPWKQLRLCSKSTISHSA